jgi:hypothetical protein
MATGPSVNHRNYDHVLIGYPSVGDTHLTTMVTVLLEPPTDSVPEALERARLALTEPQSGERDER